MELNGSLDKALNKYPNIDVGVFTEVVRKGIKELKRYNEEAENPEFKLGWDVPIVQLQYDVELDSINDISKEDEDEFYIVTIKNETPEITLLKEITHYMGAYYNHANGIKRPLAIKPDTNFDNLSPIKKQQFVNNTKKKYFPDLIPKPPHFNVIARTIDGVYTGVVTAKDGKTKKIKVGLNVHSFPLFVKKNKDKTEGHYILTIGLIMQGYMPIHWQKEDSAEFWESLDKIFLDLHPQTSLGFQEKTKEPEVKPVPQGTQLIKASMHLENQKFGRKPKPAQPSIFGELDTEDIARAEEHNINIVGVDFTASQNRALFALQTLLAKTEHKGNLKGKVVEMKSFKYEGIIPSLIFTRSEFLDTYGVTKRETTRGKMEYNSNESEEALKALKSLSENKYLLYYTRKYFDEEDVEKYDVIRTVRSLVNIVEGFKDLTELEKDIVISDKNSRETNTKLSHIVVELSPTFIDQIDNYYVLKPANVYEELKIKAPHSSKFVYRFIDYLLAQVSKKQSKYKGNNKDWNIKINYKNLAHILKMDSWIKTRNWKQVRGSLNKSYKIAKELGYLEDYKTTQGKTGEIELLTLNPDKFYKAEEIKKTREIMENEARI